MWTLTNQTPARVLSGSHYPRQPKAAQGTALLAVLWLSAALATIAISLADTVRGEAERSATAVDGLRSQDLAIGGLRRAILYMDWGRTHPDNPRFKPPVPFFAFDFPEGQTVVDVIPETAKFNINSAPQEDLFSLLVNLGVDPARAQDIAAAIVDWRSPPPELSSSFDDFYASLHPPYLAPHARFQEIEELLSVKGVTPDLFYGTWQPTPEGAPQHLSLRTGLGECVSVFGATRQFDVNTAPPAAGAARGGRPAGGWGGPGPAAPRASLSHAGRSGAFRANRRPGLRPPAHRRIHHVHAALHGPPAPGVRPIVGPAPHRRRAGEIPAGGLRHVVSYPALVRHRSRTGLRACLPGSSLVCRPAQKLTMAVEARPGSRARTRASAPPWRPCTLSRIRRDRTLDGLVKNTAGSG